jgi:hypothetical protein
VGFVSFVVIAVLGPEVPARAGRRARRAAPAPVTYRARPVPAPSSTLGIFQPTPAIMVGGSYPAGSVGYAPLGIDGDQTMALYGPFSGLRVTTAPVVTYSRGYNGEVRVNRDISTSYPNLPRLSPVMYPTGANNYYGPRVIRTPWWDSAINWIDQN